MHRRRFLLSEQDSVRVPSLSFLSFLIPNRDDSFQEYFLFFVKFLYIQSEEFLGFCLGFNIGIGHFPVISKGGKQPCQS